MPNPSDNNDDEKKFTLKDLKDVIQSIVTDTAKQYEISPETHKQHHEYLAKAIKKEEKKKQFWENMGTDLARQAIIVAAGFIFLALVLGSSGALRSLLGSAGVVQ